MQPGDWVPIRPFLIDDGQLDSYGKPECFVLGFELCEIDRDVKSGKRIERPIHAANKERAEWMLKKLNRTYRLTYMHQDKSEEWMWLHIEAGEPFDPKPPASPGTEGA